MTGRIVPCDGPGELARAVVELLNRPEAREEMGKAGRRWVESQFSWNSLAQQAGEHFGMSAGHGEFGPASGGSKSFARVQPKPANLVRS